MAPPQVLLSDYLQSLRDILHEQNDNFASQAAKIRWINSGLLMRDIITKYNRVLKSVAVTIGVDNYTFTTLGDANIFDVIGVYVLYGNLRLLLEPFSFSMLNVKVRQYQPLFQSCPAGWARYGANTIYIAPAPSQAFTMEFDCAKYSTPLALLTDADTLPYPYTEPVPYYAAYLFKLNERQNDEAQDFLDSFWMACAVATGERTGALRNAYAGDRRFA